MPETPEILEVQVAEQNAQYYRKLYNDLALRWQGVLPIIESILRADPEEPLAPYADRLQECVAGGSDGITPEMIEEFLNLERSLRHIGTGVPVDGLYVSTRQALKNLTYLRETLT